MSRLSAEPTKRSRTPPVRQEAASHRTSRTDPPRARSVVSGPNRGKETAAIVIDLGKVLPYHLAIALDRRPAQLAAAVRGARLGEMERGVPPMTNPEQQYPAVEFV